MEAASLALSAAQTLMSALQCPELKEMSSFFDYKSQLDELQHTVSTVKAVLLDAETKQELSNQAQNYIQKLKDVVYDADDLLDEFVTIAAQKQILQDGKASEKVRQFFSRFNPLVVASKMSKRVKKIKNKLEGIANDHTKFGFGIDSNTISKRREETCSYVYEGTIVGRKDDVEKIVGILLDSNVQHQNKHDVSILSIVGIGGLGKTALAQLLFNDVRVTSAFPKRLWTCVSDHEQEKLDINGILCKILTSATGDKVEGLPMDEVQRQLQRQLEGKKYLLVLDDVWTEKRNDWLNLVAHLLGGHMGSCIVVTTRSEETARIIGSNSVHKLQGLSEEHSWNLFKKVAFESEQANPPDDLVSIGENIVKGCAGVPLALRVVGSLLYGQDKSKWLSVLKMGLASIRGSQNDIMPVLMISYHNLESSLKSCFSYCALFPKDFEIEKNVLLSLWMAQGYVVPLDGGQNIEDAAEEYFSILLRRCFFQDVKKYGKTDEIYACKIHDLMHDLAQKVAAKEIFVSDYLSDHPDETVRHLAHIGIEAPKYSLNNMTHLRSYVRIEACRSAKQNLEALMEKFTSVRVLYLQRCNVQYLPKAIGNLLHLRYLNLSETELVELPQSFTKLYNLETLILDECTKLKELPKDISKLVKLRVLSTTSCTSLADMPSDLVKLSNLRVLNMGGCKKLTSIPSDLGNLGELRVLHLNNCGSLIKMPSGLDKLTNLESLSRFTLREASPSCKEWFDHLEELKPLVNLKGGINFEIQSPKDSKIECRGGGYLKNQKSLHGVCLKFIEDDVDGTAADTEETLMEALEPHCDLKELIVRGYHGVRMPSWGSSLSNLIKMKLVRCEELQELRCLGNLHKLKELELQDLPKLEYIIEKCTGTTDEDLSYLPSLARLKFDRIPRLQGWGIRVSDDNLQLFCLPQLESLEIKGCPEVTSFPWCPSVESLSLNSISDRLHLKLDTQRDNEKTEAMSQSESSLISKLRDVKISTDNMTWLKSLSMESIQHVTSIDIWRDQRVESWEAIEQVLLRSRSSCSLGTLLIDNCRKLGSICEQEEEIGMPLPCINHSIRHLRLDSLPEMKALPNWIRWLASLQTLDIMGCKKLETLPIWMSELATLEKLTLRYCSTSLKERCQKPSGENWSYIQHIPTIKIDESTLQG